jgi:hypothetical protein
VPTSIIVALTGNGKREAGPGGSGHNSRGRHQRAFLCVRARVFVRAYPFALRLPWACVVPDRLLAAAAFAFGEFGFVLALQRQR